MYSVNYWGSHPEAGNDDCWTGEDFASFLEANEVFNRKVGDRDNLDTAYVELDGPDVYVVRKNPGFRPSRKDDGWRLEMAMEAGMLHGCDGYNEVMDWD